ncbi:MAG: TIGR01777 family oxidoreductase [Bacteroidales bacterium]
MKIAISGSTGLIGSTLSTMFSKEGHEVISMGRHDLYGKPDELAEKIKAANVVIHLAGAPIQQRWTAKNKEEIYNSRIVTTRNLVEAMGHMWEKPSLFLCASAANIYPEAGAHTEASSARETSFLGKVIRDWEAEAAKATMICRTVHCRTAMVLSDKGGALKTLLPPFRWGIGGRVGSGKQIVSWIHIQDYAGIVKFLMGNDRISGPVNFSSPNPVTNAFLSKTLARTIHRPSVMVVPPIMLKLLYGKGSVVVVHGLEVLPDKVLKAGYRFRFPVLQDALEDLLDG